MGKMTSAGQRFLIGSKVHKFKTFTNGDLASTRDKLPRTFAWEADGDLDDP